MSKFSICMEPKFVLKDDLDVLIKAVKIANELIRIDAGLHGSEEYIQMSVEMPSVKAPKVVVVKFVLDDQAEVDMHRTQYCRGLLVGLLYPFSVGHSAWRLM